MKHLIPRKRIFIFMIHFYIFLVLHFLFICVSLNYKLILIIVKVSVNAHRFRKWAIGSSMQFPRPGQWAGIINNTIRYKKGIQRSTIGWFSQSLTHTLHTRQQQSYIYYITSYTECGEAACNEPWKCTTGRLITRSASPWASSRRWWGVASQCWAARWASLTCPQSLALLRALCAG